ncbi:MAG TPA: ribosome biogenesis GTPase Der [Myxococcota bacterium]|nr:ribosome biogenesis GTPase Der [Myxococcota bacterium]HNH46232.1 ribosome biogenesis GTPase Der [Myxococcota bacterium]
MLPVVAIVGRPNVGKSTLFNRLTGTRKALVHDRPGVTRDRNYETAAWEERSYLLIDTGGFDHAPGDPLYAAMRRQSEAAMMEADVVIFLVDRQSGITPADQATADLIREVGKPVVVAVNKCDEPLHDDDMHAFWELGFPVVVGVSAEHSRGLFELMTAVCLHFPPAPAETEVEGEIRVAVLGRPNVGKSTLLNCLIGEERYVVHDMPGTTVDASDTVIHHEGQAFRLVDTAGIRRRSRIFDRVEELAVSLALRTIERCHVVLYVLDGTQPPGEQDARLVGMVLERGRAVVVVVNKWDAVRQMEERGAAKVEEEIAFKMPHIPWAPVLFTSALTGKGTQRVLTEVRKVYGAFDSRISTARLNDFLKRAVQSYQPPMYRGKPVKLNYVTQVRVRPPTFSIFTNQPEGVGDSYMRYLQKKLREEYGFEGTPLVVLFRKKRRLSEASTLTPEEEGAEGWEE